jgi:hypothetical protein
MVNTGQPLVSLVQETWVILHHGDRYLVPATIVPLDDQNSRLFADWDLEEWESLRKLEWYRRPFVRDLLGRQADGQEKTFVLLTRLADFPRLLAEIIARQPDLSPRSIALQVQAALTIEIGSGGTTTTIYNIETAPWNKFGPDKRFLSLPAAALFFFAAEHHLAETPGGGRFILSHPTDDGVKFYTEKLGLNLRWSQGMDRYAVVDRSSLERTLSSFRRSLELRRQTLPRYEPR